MRKTSNSKSKNKTNMFEKAFHAWIKYDPLVSAVVKDDDVLRKQVMLNLLGKKAAQQYYSHIKISQVKEVVIFPNIVRELVDESLQDTKKRTKMINKLIYWATDSVVNNAYISSHLTRKQVVQSLLGPVFFHSTEKQEELIMGGLKFMLINKKLVSGEKGEQSPKVHRVLLDKISDLLIHNQKVIINKVVSEAEEKMRVNLIRQIQNLRGEKHPTAYHTQDLKTKVKLIVKGKFPLTQKSRQHLENMLDFYMHSNWLEYKMKAQQTSTKLTQLRHPLTLTSPELSR